ncbi:hypothetical protein TSAR_007938, partial [Trichomalopsis sarcophagae]
MQIYRKDCTNNILTINKLRTMDIGQAFIEINLKGIYMLHAVKGK